MSRTTDARDLLDVNGEVPLDGIAPLSDELNDWHLTAAREICGALAEIDSMRHGGAAFGGEVYRDGMCDDMPVVQRVLEILNETDPATA